MLRDLFLALVAMASLVGGSPALADDSAMNKEGYWSVGRNSADSDSCFASIVSKSKEMLTLMATGGDVVLFAYPKPALSRGRKGELVLGDHTFEFKPEFGERGLLLIREPLTARQLAAFRLAEGFIIKVDGQVVFDGRLEGTGHEGALDGVIACASGERGWWGPGVQGKTANAESKDGDLVYNKEGIWGVEVDRKSGDCTAYAKAPDDAFLVLVAFDGKLTFGVGAPKLRKGRKGVFSTEAYSFEFQPTYEGDSYLYLNDTMNERSLAALRLARSLTVSVDRHTVLDVTLEGSGVDALLTDLAACSRGERGWWGEGAAPAQDADDGDETKSDHKGGSGSAFFIGPGGLAVTAAHVVSDCSSVRSPRWGTVKVLAVDKRADLAVLKTETAGVQFVSLRGRGPKLGEAVSAGGYPLGDIVGSGLKITTGVVSGLSGIQGDRGLFQISAPIQPGNSGGPVIDAGGALIGVTSAKLNELKFADATGVFPQNVNFAVPVTILQAFLDENGVDYRTASDKGGTALQTYTFSLVCAP